MYLSERIVDWIDCEVGEILDQAQISPDMDIHMYQPVRPIFDPPNQENSWCIVAKAKGLNYFSQGLSTFDMNILTQIADFFSDKKFSMTIEIDFFEKGFIRKNF